MRVHDIMTRTVRSCAPDTNLAEVVHGMWEADCGAVPVLDSAGALCGILTDRDICVALATRGKTADQLRAMDVLQGPVYSCAPSDSALEALHAMKTHRVRRLPVVDDAGTLQGIVSLNDIVTHAGAAPPSAVVNTLSAICGARRLDANAHAPAVER